MELKLIIFDVDGTLYDLKSHCIPQSCTEAIRQLKRNKIRFAIASGRAHYGMGKALNDLRADYIIADSGGVIVDSEGNMLYHEDMPFAECCQLLEFARQEEAGLVFKFPQHMYIYQHPEKVDWLQGQMNSDIGSEPFIFHPEQDRHYLELPQCASIHADPERIKAFAQHSTLSFRQFSEYGFDVAPQGVNKGSGIRRLLSLLDLPKSQCTCFGDNYNDIEMMESCGFRVAMGNAVPEIKAMADHVTTATDEDGILLGLQHLGVI